MINFRPFLFFDQHSTLSHEFEFAKGYGPRIARLDINVKCKQH